MAKLNTEDLLAQFKEMTLVELSEFVKSFETEFDVTAAAPVAAAAPAAEAVVEAPAVEAVAPEVVAEVAEVPAAEATEASTETEEKE